MPTIQQLVDELEAEINNGGFDQFFFNPTGDFTEETIQAVSSIGAFHTAEIVKKGASLFPGGMLPKDQDSRQKLVEEISPNSDAFEEFDDAFLAYENDFASLILSYNG